MRAGQPAEQRMGILAVDLDLREHREGDPVVHLAELGDLGIGAGLLVHELVAGEAEHRQAPLPEALVQLLQPGVLGREPAATGGVDHEHHGAEVLGELLLLAGEGGGGEVGESRHGSIVARRADAGWSRTSAARDAAPGPAGPHRDSAAPRRDSAGPRGGAGPARSSGDRSSTPPPDPHSGRCPVPRPHLQERWEYDCCDT